MEVLLTSTTSLHTVTCGWHPSAMKNHRGRKSMSPVSEPMSLASFEHLPGAQRHGSSDWLSTAQSTSTTALYCWRYLSAMRKSHMMVWATARGRSEADVFTYLWGSDAGKPRVKEGRQAWDGSQGAINNPFGHVTSGKSFRLFSRIVQMLQEMVKQARKRPARSRM